MLLASNLPSGTFFVLAILHLFSKQHVITLGIQNHFLENSSSIQNKNAQKFLNGREDRVEKFVMRWRCVQDLILLHHRKHPKVTMQISSL